MRRWRIRVKEFKIWKLLNIQCIIYMPNPFFFSISKYKTAQIHDSFHLYSYHPSPGHLS